MGFQTEPICDRPPLRSKTLRIRRKIIESGAVQLGRTVYAGATGSAGLCRCRE